MQAATSDPYAKLTAAEAGAATIAPMLDTASRLYGETVDLGHSRLDLTAVLDAIEARVDRTSNDVSGGT